VVCPPAIHWDVRHFFRRLKLPITRMLIVESGSRLVLEAGIQQFRAVFGDRFPIDLLTCLPGLPGALDPATTRVFRVTQCRTGAEQRGLLAQLRAARYPVLGMVCSDEPVMTLWKLAAALVVPAKVVIFNENSDFFWVDWRHRQAIRQFLLVRAGIEDDAAVRKLAQLAAFPFILAYLILYAGWVHLVRAVRLAFRH